MIKLRGIEPEPNPGPKKDLMESCDDFNHVGSSIWRQHLPKIFGGQDGRVVKARVFGRYSRLGCVE
jgi:hypothetical protein